MSEVWDAQAHTLEQARWAVWAEPDWDQGRNHCLAHLDALPPAGALLDLGAGVGRLTLPVAVQRPQASLHAVDISTRMLRWLTRLARENEVPNITTHLSAGEHVPTAVPMGLAGAWSVLTFQHLPVTLQKRYLSEMAQLLSPGAPLVVQFVDGADPGPLSNPMDSELMGHCASYFGLGRWSIEPDPVFPTWRWLHAWKEA